MTLFFGLLCGPVEIGLSAAPGAERGELFVDGDLVSELTASAGKGGSLVP